jgi:ferric-dicitrate binding protein FerR (iron transport regulator)
MVDRRIKPYAQQHAEAARRAQQRHLFRRNQALGLLMVAAAIFGWWVLHTRPGWVLPAGWWHW